MSVMQETVVDRYIGHVLVMSERVLLCRKMCGLNSLIQSNTTQAYLKLSCAFGYADYTLRPFVKPSSGISIQKCQKGRCNKINPRAPCLQSQFFTLFIYTYIYRV